jgi:hypothetical protein
MKTTFFSLNKIQDSIQIGDIQKMSDKQIFEMIASIESFKNDINTANKQ